jgi:hypothetical protein
MPRKGDALVPGVGRKRFWAAALLGIAIFYYTLRRADLNRLLAAFRDIDPLWAVLVIAASVSSYLCIAAVLHRLLKNMGHGLAFPSSLQISLLSCTLNYLMALGGLSGVAAKVYLLAREDIPPSRTLSISIVHGFLTNTVAVVFIYLGFFFLYSEYKMNTREMEVGILILVVAFLLTWLTIQTLVHESFRRALWQFCLRTVFSIGDKLHRPKWLNRERAETFFENFNDSMNLLVRNTRMLLAPAGFALCDWALMFVCLKCSFLAAHYPVDNSTLLVGFSIGIFTGLFSITPASLGLMEGSMAGSFFLMGLDYDTALVATLIYRIAYFVLPIVVSIPFYKRFFPASPEPATLGHGERTS